MNLVIRGPYWYPDSYSHIVRSIAIALDKAGVDVTLMPVSLNMWNHVPNRLTVETVEKLKSLEKDTINKPYTMLQICIPPQYIFDPSAKKLIGWTCFETDRIPPQWVIPAQAMDEIWVPSMFNHNAWQQTGLRPGHVSYLPFGYDPEIFTPDGPTLPIEGLDNMIVYGANFDWTPRKNGEFLINSFLETFRDRQDVILILKSYHKQALLEGVNDDFFKRNISAMREQLNIGKYPQIMVLSDILPPESMGAFYRTLDYFVSIAHGEGFNLPVMEAMACGVPSIVTGWSSHMDWCNAENSFPIYDCPLGGVTKQQVDQAGNWYANSRWAYPSLSQVSANMQFTSKLSDEAYKTISDNCIARAEKFTWDNIAKHIVSNLGDNDERNE